MPKNPYKFWVPVIVCAWLFDWLFWDQAVGINFAIFWTAALAAALYVLLSEKIRPHRTALALIPFFLFFAAVTFLRSEPMTVFLASSFSMFTLALLAVTYQGGRWLQYSLIDYLVKFVSLLGSLAYRPGAYIAAQQKTRAESGEKPQRVNLLPVVRGVLLALPVVAIFAVLLASADAVFSQKLENIATIFKLENLPEYVLRFFIIVIIGHSLAGIILHAAGTSPDEKLAGEGKTLLRPFFGFTEAAIVLGSVVALFAAFVVVQFQYFFGGAANISIEGYTYAEYARRGFGELVAVAFFALLLLLALSSVTRRESETQRRTFSGLGVALVLLLLVILFSAYQRLSLYEAAYGFSRLRTYTHIFLVWIGLLLLATIALEITRKTRLFTVAMLAASLGFAMSLPILNVDGFIVRQNIQREVQGSAVNELDAQYFTELSVDAVPVLAKAFRDEQLPAVVRERVGAALACFNYQYELDRDQTTWQSFNFAQWNAGSALKSLSADLAAYRFLEGDWPKSTASPSGHVFSCQMNTGD